MRFVELHRRQWDYCLSPNGALFTRATTLQFVKYSKPPVDGIRCYDDKALSGNPHPLYICHSLLVPASFGLYRDEAAGSLVSIRFYFRITRYRYTRVLYRVASTPSLVPLRAASGRQIFMPPMFHSR